VTIPDSVTITDSVTRFGKFAFFSCSRLTSVTIPDSVTSIGSQVFYNCTSLANVTFLGAAPDVEMIPAPGHGYFGVFKNLAPDARAVVSRKHLASWGQGANWHGIIVGAIPTVIDQVHLNGSSFTIQFEGEESITEWRIMASSDLIVFDDDLTAASVITEIAPGKYEAVIDITGQLPSCFFRVE